MTIILRLQGLDAKAGTEDIRTFFGCLRIPDGGVYIVGGSLREAFIAFSDKRDAQLAMQRTGEYLKGSVVTLHMSSMGEMEHKIQSLLKDKKPSRLAAEKPRPHSPDNVALLNARPHDDSIVKQSSSPSWPQDPDTANLSNSNPQPVHPSTADVPASTAQPLDSNTAFLLGICTVLHGLNSSHTKMSSGHVPKADTTAVLSEVMEQTANPRPGYVRLFGLPASTTEEDICHFFKKLSVEEVIVNVQLGLNYGSLVKFAKMEDALDALCFNQQYLGSSCVEVRGADEKIWNSALSDFDVGVRQRDEQHSLQEVTNKRKSVSALPLKRPADWFSSKPSKKPNYDSNTPLSPSKEPKDHVIMVRNLPKKMTKTEIKELFGCPNISHKNVLHLLDYKGNTTDTSFLIFNCTEDFDYAMNLSGCHVGSCIIEVSAITLKMMREIMAKSNPRIGRHHWMDPRKQQSKRQSRPGATIQV